jgi:hypothetical protein
MGHSERQHHSLFNTQRITRSDINDIFAIMHVFGGTLYLLDIGLGVRMLSACLSILSQTADGVRERRMQDECKGPPNHGSHASALYRSS